MLIWYYSRQNCGHIYAHWKATSAIKGTRTRVAGIQSHRAWAKYTSVHHFYPQKRDSYRAFCFGSDFTLLPMLISHAPYMYASIIFTMSYNVYITFCYIIVDTSADTYMLIIYDNISLTIQDQLLSLINARFLNLFWLFSECFGELLCTISPAFRPTFDCILWSLWRATL